MFEEINYNFVYNCYRIRTIDSVRNIIFIKNNFNSEYIVMLQTNQN